MTDFDLITLLMQRHPGLLWTIIVGAAGFIFNAGGTYVNYRFMRQSMVTKKDLKIALLEQNTELATEYVTRREFAAHLGDKPNGRMRGAGHGGN